jgi:membrane protease YdiL (CAAX protease family)
LPGGPSDYGVNLRHFGISVVVGLVGGLSILVPSFLWLARSPGLLGYYPEMRINKWSLSLIAVNTASWVVYLAAYELLFRGILLFPLIAPFGVWPAIFVTDAYYTLAHLRKHPIECSLVAPGGIMFGLWAVYTGSLLGPFIAHVMIAAGTEILAIRIWSIARTPPPST